MKYLTDEHIPLLLAQLLRTAGIDVRTAQECGLLGQPDEELLAFAAQESRCLVTANVRDFPRIARDFAAHDERHAGIACGFGTMPTTEAQHVAAQLVRLHEQYPHGVDFDLFVYLIRSKYS